MKVMKLCSIILMLNSNKVFASMVVISLGLTLISCNQKVSVSPPDAPPPNGFIYITSKPEGFHIYLDGKPRRRATPDSLTWLSTGTYQIALKKDLFRDTSFSVDIVEGEKKSKFVDLLANPGMLGNLYCSSKPEGAEIFLNDSSTGKLTPDTLRHVTPAYYRVRFHLKNHIDDSANIPVSSSSLSSAYKVLVDSTLWHFYNSNNSPMLNNNITCVTVDKNNVVWAGTDSDGVISFDGINWGGKQIFNHLKSKHVNCVTVDNNNTLLIGTEQEMYIYGGTSSGKFESGDFRVRDIESGTKGITAIGFDNTDDWYVGSTNGLSVAYLVPGQSYRTWHIFSNEVIPDTFITSISTDNSGHVWVGMQSKGIAEDVSNNWIVYYAGIGTIINNDVRAIAGSQSDGVWIGFGKEGGEGLTNYNNGVWRNVYVLPPASQTNAILVDNNNNKWVATNHGLVKFTTASDETVFNYDNTGLNLNDVTGLAQDLRGNIWISDYGGGLIEYKGDH